MMTMPENMKITGASMFSAWDKSLMSEAPPEYEYNPPVAVKKGAIYYQACDTEHCYLYVKRGKKDVLLATGNRKESQRERLFREFWEYTERHL